MADECTQTSSKPQTLTEFFAALDKYADRVPLDELIERMKALKIDEEEIRPVARFGRTAYQRNLLHTGSGYQALILCWRPGQRSPIHDHRGSSCGVRVLKGIATETAFERTPEGWICATGSRELHEGLCCGSQDTDIHQVSNLQAGVDLITLHVYSPPLLTMGTYSLTDTQVGEFRDPIVGFVAGDGI